MPITSTKSRIVRPTPPAISQRLCDVRRWGTRTEVVVLMLIVSVGADFVTIGRAPLTEPDGSLFTSGFTSDFTTGTCPLLALPTALAIGKAPDFDTDEPFTTGWAPDADFLSPETPSSALATGSGLFAADFLGTAVGLSEAPPPFFVSTLVLSYTVSSREGVRGRITPVPLGPMR